MTDKVIYKYLLITEDGRQICADCGTKYITSRNEPATQPEYCINCHYKNQWRMHEPAKAA